jgi:2-methylcitrate dehydratase
VLFKGKPFEFERGFGSYVMENVLFKISFPAEFHAQTAVECALALHEQVAGRIDDVQKIVIETQEAGVRIIDKTGPLNNFADRDHCIQYMVAVPLIHGALTAEHYEDHVAADPRIDALRSKMEVRENPQFTKDYFDVDKRYIGNAVQVFFKDGTSTDRVAIDFPIGHRQRRAEGIPVLIRKFEDALAAQLPKRKVREILDLTSDVMAFESTPIHHVMDLLAI